ncbi:CDP-alcohol phosphatidyltransferase family protein [Maribellus sp. YY47]|uniref:CDP-alcohol phosphatidyltransferase family protein n=1 Tax=Maribellus sp. YY47 TaxID=2929486 RepID=UPI0020009EC9|nr:CDP-alcohol phosphatidyltransferase family protein [Maribellus sp. YY47]MCK3686260.1 CDP-alcohol phosphatidyltransferase family protein [Maribellus sp. YY47]
MNSEKVWNIPNALSLYRIIVFPFVMFLVVSGNEEWFAIFLCINLFTDFLDGFIARTFNMVTKLGARLDSLADYGTYILAFTGVLTFKKADLTGNAWILYLFIAMMLMTQAVHFRKFKTFSSYHLYSFKVTGYLQALLFFTWFFVGFWEAYYYFAIGFGILAELETITITFLLRERRSNAQGLYWVLKQTPVTAK